MEKQNKIIHDLDVMNDASEVVHHDEPGIPIYIQWGLLSYFQNYRALCHWHDDIEWIYIKSGHMSYHINGQTVELHEGDCLMVNSRQLHYGFSDKHDESFYLCILFQPSMLFGSHVSRERYVDAFCDVAPDYYLLRSGTASADAVTEILLDIDNQKKAEHTYHYVLQQYELFLKLWKLTLTFPTAEALAHTDNDPDLKTQRKMVSFIKNNYGENISLDDIAAAGNVSRSKCCKLFKKYSNETPGNYLNEYRLEIASYLLTHSKESITTIALTCGFNHLSYFSKCFYEKYGVNPSKVRAGRHVQFQNLPL